MDIRQIGTNDSTNGSNDLWLPLVPLRAPERGSIWRKHQPDDDDDDDDGHNDDGARRCRSMSMRAPAGTTKERLMEFIKVTKRVEHHFSKCNCSRFNQFQLAERENFLNNLFLESYFFLSVVVVVVVTFGRI